MMRADNDGEGGILALLALAQRRLVPAARSSQILIGLALAGTALFFCDALITPAVSVLSAVEGLELINPALEHWTVPVTLACSRPCLPSAARHRACGTALRAHHDPVVFWCWQFPAPPPLRSIRRFWPRSTRDSALLSTGESPRGCACHPGRSVPRADGREALYADMGHFGKAARAHRLVLPRLACTPPQLLWSGCAYLTRGKFIEHPLYVLILPDAAVHAGARNGGHRHRLAAVISGAFSVTRSGRAT